MPRAISKNTKKPILTKSRSHAHDLMLELKELNRKAVNRGHAKTLKYRVIKLKKGFGIYYKQTGRWR